MNTMYMLYRISRTEDTTNFWVFSKFEYAEEKMREQYFAVLADMQSYIRDDNDIIRYIKDDSAEIYYRHNYDGNSVTWYVCELEIEK